MKTATNVPAMTLDEVTGHTTSFADPNGRLFWWNDELYRGITEDAAPLCRDLFERGVVDRLVAKGLLVDGKVSSHTLAPYPVVLQHRAIPFVSYPYEWCMLMLKDAALTVLDLELELDREGLTLQDAHPWNIVFDGSRPVWVDFGSILHSRETPWPAYDEFCRFFLYPLFLAARGHGRIARWLLHDHDHGVLESDMRAVSGNGTRGLDIWGLVGRVNDRAKKILPATLRPVARRVGAGLKSRLREIRNRSRSGANVAHALRREIEAIDVIPPDKGWTEYYEEAFPPFAPSPEWTAKHHRVYQILSACRASSLLDIGSNRGWYAQLAARLGSRVVAYDTDEASLTQLYLDCRKQELLVLPLVMDFRNPSPGYGLLNTWFPPATQRFRCDMVLALALVHHLVFKQSLNFEQIVDGLAALSKKWLVVEFVTERDTFVKDWITPRYSWYTLENFTAALGQHFRTVKVSASHPDGRFLVFCEV